MKLVIQYDVHYINTLILITIIKHHNIFFYGMGGYTIQILLKFKQLVI